MIMKKILLILLVALSFQVSGQVIASNTWFLSSSGYVGEYQAVLDAMTTKPTGDTLVWQNDMMYTLDTANVLDSLDGLWIFACTGLNGDNEALINWMDPTGTSATAVSSPAWSGTTGYTGDGAADYINLNWNPTDDGTEYTLNAASLGIYLRTWDDDGAEGLMGCDDAVDDSYLYRNGTNTSGRNNSGGSVIGGTTAYTGNIATVRRASNEIEIYRQGVSWNTDTDASTGLSDIDFAVLATATVTTPSFWTDENISIAWVGGAMSDQQITSMSTAFETYMDHLGTGVQE